SACHHAPTHVNLEVIPVRRRQTAWLAAVGAVVLLSWQAQLAHAAENPTDSARPDSGRHCVVGLHAAQLGAATEPQATEPACFDTFAEAIDFATGGRVRLPKDATQVSERQLLAAGAISTARAPVARPLVGIEYQHTNFGGASLTLYGASGTGCYAGTWYGFPDLASLDFDNRISSGRTYSNCIGKHHDGTNYTGTYTYCETSCSTLGSMNDRTSSIKFF